MIKARANTSDVIKGLRTYEKNTATKLKTLLIRLHRIGVVIAESNLKTIQYDGSHDTKVVREPYWEGDKLILSVQGEKITFIEFGTGTYYADVHELAGEFGFGRGTFGRELGANPPWYFIEPTGVAYGEVEAVTSKGNLVIKSYGNPPNRVVYNTAKEMRQRVLEVAKEVYRDG